MTDTATANLARLEVHYIDNTRRSIPDPEITSLTITIKSAQDIVAARQQGRLLAEQLEFSTTKTTLVATVISELARNILVYAGRGDIILTQLEGGDREGLLIKASDNGPGIADIERAMRSGYSTSGGLGLGLPGIRLMVDGFDIESIVGSGTTVSTYMWCR